MRFDAYRATVPAMPVHVQRILMDELGNPMEASPHKNYKKAVHWPMAGARLNWGGHNLNPFLDVQGDHSPVIADIIREHFTYHSVSRADACVDFKGGRDEFKRVGSDLVTIAKKWGVSTRLIASPSDDEKGQTLYIGSRTSEVMVRLYEKGKQLQEVKGQTPENPDLIRFEIEVKPNKADRKQLLARTAPQELPSFSRWSIKACSLVTGSIVPFQPRVSERRTEAQKALDHMCAQYKGQGANFARIHGRKALKKLLVQFYRDCIEVAGEESQSDPKTSNIAGAD